LSGQELEISTEKATSYGLALHEFYEFMYKTYGTIQVRYLPPEEYDTEYNCMTPVERILKCLDTYDSIFKKAASRSGGMRDWNDLLSEKHQWYFTYKENETLHYFHNMPHMNLLKIRNLLTFFEMEVADSLNLSNLVKWKICTSSLIRGVILAISNVLKNTLKKDSKVFLEVKEDDLISILTYYLNHSILKTIIISLIQIIKTKLKDFSKTHLGVYIIFEEEKEPAFIEKVRQLDHQYLTTFDKIIRFTRTKFVTIDKMLLVRLNYMTAYESIDPIRNFDQVKSSMEEHMHETGTLRVALILL